MNDKTEQKTLNGVNGTANSSSSVALGGSVSQQQGRTRWKCITAAGSHSVEVYHSSRVALGGSVSQQQGTFDRHPVTVCNLRKKTRIAT